MNINKIKLSGTTYNIQDENATKTVELTQAQYDALAVKDPNTFYVITDATAGDLSNYYTSAQTESAITAAVSGKVDTSSVVTAVTSASTDNEIPTAKAVYDAIPTGGTGGGKAISAGTNISVTTGETADTVSCTLNLVNGGGTDSVKMKNTQSSNGSYSFSIGSNGVKANGLASFAGGSYSEANGIFSMAFGRYAKANNYGEAAFGFFGISNGSSSAAENGSGNTLFSVGNGTNGYGGKHNAFEIRQNGDIYLSYNGNDVKLQDLIADIYSKLPTS